MEKDTGINSELEHADTQCADQENQRKYRRKRASRCFSGHKMYIVNCKSALLANSSPNKHKVNSGALARGAPWVRKCGKLPIRENLVMT